MKHVVVFVCGVGGHGGPIQSVRTVMPHLGKYERILLGAWGSRAREFFSSSIAERVVSMPRPRGWGALRASIRVGRQLAAVRGRTVLVHANGLTELAIVALPAFLFRVPVFVWVHNWEIPRLLRAVRPLLRAGSGKIRFAAVSSFARDLVTNANLVAGDTVRVIANPIAGSCVPAERRPADERYLRVGYLGTDRPYKGFDLLPRIIEASADAPVRWLIFTSRGPTPEAGWRELVRLQQSMPGRVVVRGRVRNVAEAYGECDIILIPSRRESFCRVATEAMLNGLPVVASNLPPLREQLGDCEAGVLFPVGDVEAAAAAVRRLALSQALRQRLGAVGIARARRFDVPTVVSSLTEEYDNLLSPG